MTSTNRVKNNETDFCDLNELELSSTDFSEIVSLFQTLRKWKNESTNTPEVDTVEPDYSCEK